MQQADPEVVQDGIRPPVKGIMQHILVTVVEHGAAGLVRHGEKIHDVDKGRQQQCRQVGAQFYCGLPVGDKQEDGCGK